MCYVIAKERYAHGCIAFETVHGKHLADLKWALNEALGNTGVEIMTISRPEAYGEYAPYHFVQTEEEFVAQVLALRSLPLISVCDLCSCFATKPIYELIYQFIYGSVFWLRNAAKITTHYLKSVALICRIPTNFYGDSRIFASDAFS